MLRFVVLRTIKCDRGPNGNWDASCMSGVASWAVFTDNATMLESVAEYYFGMGGAMVG